MLVQGLEDKAAVKSDLKHGAKRIDEHAGLLAELDDRGRYSPGQILVAVSVVVVGITASIAGVVVGVVTLVLGR